MRQKRLFRDFKETDPARDTGAIGGMPVASLKLFHPRPAHYKARRGDVEINSGTVTWKARSEFIKTSRCRIRGVLF